MPIQKPIVDRQTELARFTELLNTVNPSASILLVNAGSGQGKSCLLRVFKEHCRRDGIATAHIDLKSGSLTPIDIVRTVQTDLQPLTLTQCDEIIKNPPNSHLPPVQISNNKAIGQTHYSIEYQLPNLTLEEQKQWWADSAKALLYDFSKLAEGAQRRFVLLFDTYEKASLETKDWIANHILRMAIPGRVSCLYIVLAGKEIPEPTSEWEYYSQMLDLEPLQLDHWIDYAGLIQANVTHEQIEIVYKKYKEQPLKIAEWLGAVSI